MKRPDASRSLAGGFVIRFSAPPTALRPYSVPADPEATRSDRGPETRRSPSAVARGRRRQGRWPNSIRARVDRVRPNPPDRQHGVICVLRKRHRRQQPRSLVHRTSVQPLQVPTRQRANRRGRRLHRAFAHFGRRDYGLLHNADEQGERDADAVAGSHLDRPVDWRESAQLRVQHVVCREQIGELETPGGVGLHPSGACSADRHNDAWQRRTSLVADPSGQLRVGLCTRWIGHTQQDKSEHGGQKRTCGTFWHRQSRRYLSVERAARWSYSRLALSCRTS